MRDLLRWLCVAAGLAACDGAGVEDAGAVVDAGASVDAGGLDDAGPLDAGAPDAGAPAPPGRTIATGVCNHEGAVAISSAGARAAYVTCTGERAVWIVELPSGTPRRFDDVGPAATVRFSPDDAWLLYGTADAMRVRDVAAGRAPVALAAARVDEARFVGVEVAGTPALRLLTLETDAGARRIALRTDADAFASVTPLVESASLAGDLALISGSGNTLVVTIDDGARRTYERVPTDGTSAPLELPIDPDALVLGPVGMGDTHTIGRRGAGLSFVELASGAETALETDGVTTSPLFVVVDPVDGAYAYYLRDGAPTRRLRNASAPAQTLVAARSADMALSASAARLVYSSAGRLRSIALDGTDDRELVPHAGPTLDVAFSSDGASLAVIEAGAIRSVPTDGSAAPTALDGEGVVARSAAYDGSGRLVWRRASDEAGRRDALRAGSPPSSIAWDVAAWWPIPARGAVLYRATDGALRVL